MNWKNQWTRFWVAGLAVLLVTLGVYLFVPSSSVEILGDVQLSKAEVQGLKKALWKTKAADILGPRGYWNFSKVPVFLKERFTHPIKGIFISHQGGVVAIKLGLSQQHGKTSDEMYLALKRPEGWWVPSKIPPALGPLSGRTPPIPQITESMRLGNPHYDTGVLSFDPWFDYPTGRERDWRGNQ
jgi:hypothetical protein